MSDLPPRPPLARTRDADEETRYRAVQELDAERPAELAELLSCLGDGSWRVRGAAVERLAAPADPRQVLPGLLAAVDGGDSVGARDAAGAALARLGPAALPALVERLGTGGPEGRQAASAILGAIGDRRALPALAARLADADANVRASAAAALGHIGGPEAGTALLAALDSDDATLRGAALEALASLRLAPPLAQLTRLLADRALRPAAYRALGASDEPGALEALGEGLAERSGSVRLAVLDAIGRQRTRRGRDALERLARAVRGVAERQPGAADACAEALAGGEPTVAAGALTALSWIGEARHAAAVARAAEDDGLRSLAEEALEALPRSEAVRQALAEVAPALPPLARLSACATLAAAGDGAALEAVLSAIDDPDERVQEEAVAALGRLGDARAVPRLCARLGDARADVAGLAASALILIAGRSPADRQAVLGGCRADGAPGPSPAALRVLGAVGDAEDLVRARAALGAEGLACRVAAAAAVAGLAARGLARGEHLPELIAALGDGSWEVRAAAARAFHVLAEARAEDRLADPRGHEHPLCAQARVALQDRLGDDEPAVRAAALEALGGCGRPEHAPHIAALLAAAGSPPLVAAAALRALVRLGAATPALLERALRHPDAEVAKEAVAGAAGLAGAEGARLLSAAARSGRWDVRHAAARAMAARSEPELREEAGRLAAVEPDELVARAFAAAARRGER